MNLLTKLTHFIYELGHLRRIKHEGWRMAGVEHPESVADHTTRAAQIGYILAYMEGYKDPCKISTMLLFHDIGECRIGDIHKISNRYVETDEEEAVRAQTKDLKTLGKNIFKFFYEVENQKTTAGKIAKDADLLDQAFTAKEYIEIGHASAKDWIKNVGKRLQTKSAKQLHRQLQKVGAYEWWNGLKKF